MTFSRSDAEDFSASATLIFFDHPIPLLRGPFPASPSDNPFNGSFVLAFRDDSSWLSAFRAMDSKIMEQCQAGARVGCSISASAKCKPPWWKTLFGVSATDFTAREQCEEREMSACLAASKESCIQFARDKCLPAFRDARIAMGNQKGIPKLMSGASPGSEPSLATNGIMTNYRGSVLLDSGIGIEDSRYEIAQ